MLFRSVIKTNRRIIEDGGLVGDRFEVIINDLRYLLMLATFPLRLNCFLMEPMRLRKVSILPDFLRGRFGGRWGTQHPIRFEKKAATIDAAVSSLDGG